MNAGRLSRQYTAPLGFIQMKSKVKVNQGLFQSGLRLDGGIRSQEEVAYILGISRTRVFQQEQIALQKIREALSTQDILSADSFVDIRPKPYGRVLETLQNKLPK